MQPVRAAPALLPLPDGWIDLDACVVRRGAMTVELTPTELRLLSYLAAANGKVVGRDELLQQVWGYRPGVATRTIDTTLHRLRHKIEVDPSSPTVLKAAYGLGLSLTLADGDVPAVAPPTRGSGLVGRDADLAALAASAAPVTSLVGPPGIGKSRLAREWMARWSGDVVLVPLRGAGSEADVVAAVGTAVDAAPTGRPGRWLSRVAKFRTSTLWVFDDAEAALDPLDELLQAMASELGGGARVLVTSRVAPRVGEVLRVGPLAPDAAARMFVAEARRVEPTRDHDPSSPAVAALVARLDGIPLAIELAAARTQVLGLEELDDRLARSTSVLRAGRDGPHASLDGAIELSVELLSPEERAAFAQCSVFRGGFTLEAAEAVLDVPGGEVLDLLHALRDASLLGGALDGGRMRFAMLPTLRGVAERKLDADQRLALDRRHGVWYARLGDDQWLGLVPSVAGAQARRELAAEHENLVAACRRAVARGDGEIAGPTAYAAGQHALLRGTIGVARDLITSASGSAGLSGADRARLDQLGGVVWRSMGEMERARELHLRALEAYAAEGDRWGQGLALASVAVLDGFAGRTDDASHRAVSARSMLSGRPLGELLALRALAIVAHLDGRFDLERDLLEAALAVEVTPAEQPVAMVRQGLAGAYARAGRVTEAMAQYHAARAIFQQLGDHRQDAFVRASMADLQTALGRPDEGLAEARAALDLHRQAGDEECEWFAQFVVGRALHECGDLDQAHATLTEALAAYRARGDVRAIAGVSAHLAAVAVDLGRFDEALQIVEAAGAGAADPEVRGTLRVEAGRALAGLGRVGEAQEAIAEGLATVRCAGWPVVTALAAWWLAGVTDDHALAEQLRAEARATARVATTGESGRLWRALRAGRS